MTNDTTAAATDAEALPVKLDALLEDLHGCGGLHYGVLCHTRLKETREAIRAYGARKLAEGKAQGVIEFLSHAGWPHDYLANGIHAGADACRACRHRLLAEAREGSAPGAVASATVTGAGSTQG